MTRPPTFTPHAPTSVPPTEPPREPAATTRVYVSASTGERRRHCLVCEKRRNDARPGTAEQLATLAQLVAAAGGAR